MRSEGYTINAAYSAFQENEKGSIEVGKAADFTLIDGDILNTPGERIRDLSVAMTVVDGEVVWGGLEVGASRRCLILERQGIAGHFRTFVKALGDLVVFGDKFSVAHGPGLKVWPVVSPLTRRHLLPE